MAARSAAEYTVVAAPRRIGSSGLRSGMRRVRSTKSTSAEPRGACRKSGARGVPSADPPWHQAQSRRYSTRPMSPVGAAARDAASGGTDGW